MVYFLFVWHLIIKFFIQDLIHLDIPLTNKYFFHLQKYDKVL